MQNKYQIRQSVVAGIPFVEVRGATFSCEDLYELVGRDRFMSTFVFKAGTDASSKFGQFVTGTIFYDKCELKIFERFNQEGTKLGDRRVKIDSPMSELTIAQREDLKYDGLLVPDIEYISFMSYRRTTEYYESGEKKVPNIISIPYEHDPTVDYDLLYQGYIVSKINSGTGLIPYEKEKFIGITVGINDGHIDSRLLNYLGFDTGNIRDYPNIWYHIYKTKEKRKTISEEEKAKLEDLEYIRKAENIIKLFNEIEKSGVNSEKLSKSKSIFQTLMSSVLQFEPYILLYGKKQIFWDVDSYIHIVLRHVQQLQIGHFKNKSSFPYKFEDMKKLIEQVLQRIEDEIKRHFEEKPGKDFIRFGKMETVAGRPGCLQQALIV